MKADLHVHTYFSTDSNACMQESVEVAIKRGLDAIAFTEHWDEDYPEEFREDLREANGPEGMKLHPDFDERPLFTFDIEKYFKELERVRSLYGDRIRILSGIELGMRPHRGDILKLYKGMVDKYRFDVVLGSVHLVNDEEPYYPEAWFKLGADRLIKEYYENMLECVKEYDLFTSLAHIDYVVRYVPDELIDTTPEEYFKGVYGRNSQTIDEILKIIIKRGQALEVNTNGAFTRIKHVHPSDAIMNRYKELGGTAITYGSDAHYSEKVGDGIYGI
jgi:histidinol-phosphatase (PHP family)